MSDFDKWFYGQADRFEEEPTPTIDEGELADMAYESWRDEQAIINQ